MRGSCGKSSPHRQPRRDGGKHRGDAACMISILSLVRRAAHLYSDIVAIQQRHTDSTTEMFAGLESDRIHDSAMAMNIDGLTFTTLRDKSDDHVGIRTPRGIIDVAAAAKALEIAAYPRTVEEVIAGYDTDSLMRIATEAPASVLRSEDAVEFGPLVSNPAKIICVGLNYRAHVEESNLGRPDFPDLFNKYNSSLNRHRGTIDISSLPATQFDYESELVIVMGKAARNVRESEALRYVYGYTTGNDFTARDPQLRVTQWMTGKTPDQFAPIGPWLVSADQIPDPQTLQVQTFVNDEVAPRQDTNTAQMIFSCAEIISYTSTFMTLQPGDIIFTGTPSGVILGFPKEKQIWLKAGDRVRTVISQLGELHFTLV
jgi:2-keto-4-pentenoate hydratase/2-oxohepta-3-ene-1,7-dioic acid hydratase in catechol pathway